MGNTPTVPQNPTPSDANGGVLGHAVLGALQGAAKNTNDVSLPQGAQYGTPEAQLPADATLGESTSEGQAPPAQGFLEKTGEAIVHGAEGFVKELAPVQPTPADYASRSELYKIFHPKISFISPEDVQLHGTAEKAGAFAEDVAEFIGGDEALKGLSLADKFGAAQKIAKLAETSPKIAKALSVGMNAIRSGTVGAVEGAVKAPEGQAEAGAVGGAIGGAGGTALAEGVAPLIGKGVAAVGRSMGIGLDPAVALEKALRPAGNAAQRFLDNAKTALPRLIAENAKEPIETIEDLADAANSAASQIWKSEITPQIAKFGNEVISGAPVQDAIRDGVTAGEKDLFPESADAAEDLAKKFDGDMTITQAADRLQTLNARLSRLYKMLPADRYAATAQNASTEALENAANSLRQELYAKLESLGEQDPAGLRKQYGALKEIGQLAAKRAPIYGRQNVLNLTQILSAAGGAGEAAGALLSGHPVAALAGAVPLIVASIAKTLNAPEHLIQSAVEDSLVKSGLGAAIKTGIRGAAKAVAPAVGAAVGRNAATSDNEEPNTDQSENRPELPNGYAHVRASDGREFYIPQEHMSDAYGIDAGLQLLRMAAYPSPSPSV